MLPIYIDEDNYPHGGSSLKSKSSSKLIEKIYIWWRLIVSDKISRNLLLFLILNFSFAFVELFYGVWTNSLGLISDSFHMFFDCTGLLAGLVATVITKWKANDKFSFGYVRAEVLAGFINGLFLLFISFFIFSEAIERLIEPPEVKHERLFIISVLGFIVNLIGIYAFQHGHAHGGGGHSHGGGGGSHSHGGGGGGSHSHGGGGSHSHGLMEHDNHGHNGNNNNNNSNTNHNSQIMQGVFLHILADTLGSVGVIISAILMWAFGWMIADPICSIFIAVLIFVSVLALIRESVVILMQRQPRELDNLLPTCYQKIQQLDGVLSVQEPHFWTLCSNTYVGSIKIEIERNSDPRYISSQAHFILNNIGVKQCYVQLDFPLT